MNTTKEAVLRPKFVEACRRWVLTKVSQHLQSRKVLDWSRAKLIGWFDSATKINPTQDETDFLNKKLNIAVAFVTCLEQGNVQDAVKIAREEWNRELCKVEIKLVG